jgi:hypothetical protein
VKRIYSNATSFNISTLVNTPWRTTLGGNQLGRSSGQSSWVFFGQEFQWIRLTNLGKSVANATVVVSLPKQ